MRRLTVLLTAMVVAIVLASGVALSQTTPVSPTYTIKDLGTLDGGHYSQAYDINDAGQVVGTSVGDSTGSFAHAFLYSDGLMKDLGTLEGGSASEAFGINDAGQVVGETRLSNNSLHAFLYSNGQMQDLGTLDGGIRSRAEDINDTGEIVGWSRDIRSDDRAFLYSGGQMKDLGTLEGGHYSSAWGDQRRRPGRRMVGHRQFYCHTRLLILGRADGGP